MVARDIPQRRGGRVLAPAGVSQRTDDGGFSLENMTLSQLGRARQVRVNADRTIVRAPAPGRGRLAPTRAATAEGIVAGGRAALVHVAGLDTDEGLHQRSPDSSTPQSLGSRPSVG